MQRIAIKHANALHVTLMRHHVASPPSRAVFHGVAEALGALIEHDLPQAEAFAEQLAQELGLTWMGFLKTAPAAGEHQVSPRLTVKVLAEGEPGAGQYEGTSPKPNDRSYWNRLRRKGLPHAGKKFDAAGVPGVIMIDRPYWHQWGSDMLSALTSDLERPANWATNVGAALVRYEIMDGRSHPGDGIRALPGPRWADVPSGLREQLPAPCPACGTRHIEYDVLV